MKEYTDFANVYDMFMDNVPYEEWGYYIVNTLKDYNIDNWIILDLGCGTGKITKFLSQNGYDMIGIDNSFDMLNIAMNSKDGEDILYLCQDMREFELYGTVRAVISVCDSLNYITDKEDLVTVFKLVNNYLDPNGLFIFDINSVYKYEKILSDNTFAENRDEASFIWENYYSREDMINEYMLTLFVKNGEMYEKFEETHYQKAYELDEIIEIIRIAGMEYLGSYEAFTKEQVKNDTERIFVICKEKGKAI